MDHPLKGLGKRLIESRFSPLGSVVRVRTDERVAALTFDDGPDPRFTPRLLEILGRHGARASFFMIGRAAEAHPELVVRAARAGHTVANHTYDHRSLPALSGGERRGEIRRCSRVLGDHGSRFFRPPKGHQTPGSRLDVLLCGHSVVCWSLAADDWRQRSSERMASRLIREMAPGEIVLLHDGLWDPAEPGLADRSATLEAVEMVLGRLGDEYRFVSLEELLELAPPVREPWFRDPRDGGGPAAAE